MAQLVTFLPCSNVIVDAFTNRLSLIGVMDSVQPFGVAEVQPEQGGPGGGYHYLVGPFAIITLWAKDTENLEEFDQRIIMQSPGGREAALLEPTPVAMERPFHRVLTGVPGFVFLQTGAYRLILQRRSNDQQPWTVVHEHPLLVQDIVVEGEEDRPIRLEDAPADAVPNR